MARHRKRPPRRGPQRRGCSTLRRTRATSGHPGHSIQNRHQPPPPPLPPSSPPLSRNPIPGIHSSLIQSNLIELSYSLLLLFNSIDFIRSETIQFRFRILLAADIGSALFVPNVGRGRSLMPWRHHHCAHR